MHATDIPCLSAHELSALIKSRQVSPIEATQAYLERIERIEAQLHAYITVCRDEAIAAAKQAERSLMAGRYSGPMHGIPVTVKEQMYTAGIRTTNGSTILRDFIPDHDATVIARLKAHGAVLLGKLNMSEYASGDVFSASVRTAAQSVGSGAQPRHLEQRRRGRPAEPDRHQSQGQRLGLDRVQV